MADRIVDGGSAGLVAAAVNEHDVTLITHGTAISAAQAKADAAVPAESGKRLLTTAEGTKLAGIADGATVNDTDANLKNRSNHTGVQTADTITQDATHRFVSDTEKSAWNASGITATAKKSFGLLIPQFKAVGKFDYLGAALPANQMALHSSGIGLVSYTAGTFSDGYLKLSSEVTGNQANRLDWLIAWNTAEAGASISVGLGDTTNGYLVTIANTGGNVVVTWPSGATVSAALTGTVNLSVSITTGNTWITCSLSVLGVVALALAAANPYNVPVFEVAKVSKSNLAHVYFKNNSTTSKITGFLHNAKSYDGDPTGQMLTQSVIVNSSWVTDEDENMIVLPPRASLSTPLKMAHFFHGRTQTYKAFMDVTLGDFGKTCAALLNAGIGVMGSSGGVGSTNADTDGFGMPRLIDKAEALSDVLYNNVSNIAGEYGVGWSMGGLGVSNYLKRNPLKVKAAWLSSPVLDTEESGVQSTLGANIIAASTSYYVSKTDSNTTDPRTDDGTNWVRISDPGADPVWMAKTLSVTTVTTGATSASTTVGSNAKIFPGDTLYFKWSKSVAKVKNMVGANATAINLDRTITTNTGEPVAVFPLNRSIQDIGSDFYWGQRATQEWTASSKNKNDYVRRSSANPINDIKPHNPTNFADMYAALNVPFRIMVGGDGTASGNDGILNNNQMFAFATKVNAFKAGLVTMVIGSGAHVSPTTLSAADTLSFFNVN
jgi:hypothetical protein